MTCYKKKVIIEYIPNYSLLNGSIIINIKVKRLLIDNNQVISIIFEDTKIIYFLTI